MLWPMFSSVWAYLSLLLSASLLAALLKYGFASRRPKHFPPGPPGLPVLGNLHQLPLTKAFLTFRHWNEKYGSIVGLKFGPQNVVLLNSYKHVQELFDKRGSIYSSRPANHVGNDLLCPGDSHILLVPYGPGWRRLRKATQSLLNVKAVNELVGIQIAESSQTMLELLQDPENCFKHIRRFSTAVILASVYGQRGENYDSTKVQALYHAQEQFTNILDPGATPPIDAFPFLKYLPGFFSPWRAKARAIRRQQRSLYYGLLHETSERLMKGVSPDCFMARLLKGHEKDDLSEEQRIYTGGTLMEAGSDTTSSTLQSWIISMTEHPEILQNMQNEVDKVCGRTRMPTADDIKEMPYVRAVMTETLRWRPVAPGGIPHLLTQDDHYEGYLLPKGTVVFANTWSIHQDKSEYQDPSRFWPERFMQNKFGTHSGDQRSAEEHRRVTYAFGAGRRVCPRQHLAENSMMIVMARVAWAFNIRADKMEPIDSSVDRGYSDGFVFSPKPFRVQLQVRSPTHETIILKEHAAAKAVLETFAA